MSREVYGIVQYMTNKGAWENVPLYTEDNKLVELYFCGDYMYDALKDDCYNLEASDAVALNDALGYDDDDNPDWKVIHLGSVKYLATIEVDCAELANKMQLIAEFANIYATADQIRFVYYLSY